MITYLIFIVLFLLIYFLMNRVKSVETTAIPHPPLHPLFGNIQTLKRLDPIQFYALDTLTSKLGTFFKLKLGIKWVYVATGYNEIKEINEKVSRRAPFETMWLLYFGTMKRPFGLTFDSGEEWREIKRFTLRTLRDLGFGKSSTENVILDEYTAMKEKMKSMIRDSKDGSVDVDTLFNQAALNVIWNFITGKRYDYEDKQMQKLVNLLGAFTGLAKDIFGKPLGLFPFLRFIPPLRSKFNKAASGMAECRDFVQNTIDEHKKNKFNAENPTAFIDKFILASNENQSLNSEKLLFVCFDLFVGGSETTSKSMMYALAMLIRNPEIQEKVASEISRVCGDKDQVTSADRDSLPFTEATMNEVWRFCNILPIAPPKSSPCPIKVGQYDIAANTSILSSTYSVHMDQSYWGDPDTFRPERFITPEGKYRADDRNIPFGIGKRRCLGENLARIENFLFLANIIKDFKFESFDGNLPEVRPKPGITYGPQPFSMKVSERHNFS